MSHVRALLRAVRDRLRPARLPLRGIDPHTVSSNQPDVNAAVRWLEPVTIAGTTREALLCHPDSTVTFRLDAPPRSRLIVWCGLQPESWSSQIGGVRFTLSVDVPGGRRTRSLIVDPARRARDRRWRRLSVPLPSRGTSAMLATLTTSLPTGALPANAWSIWGDPRIAWRRPLRAQLASIVGALRLLGVSGTVRRLRQLGVSSPASPSYLTWVAAHTPSDADLTRLAEESSAFPSQPLVSVIMPVFNTPSTWLSRAIQSVQRQAYPRWQLCICDDGSTDEGTRAVLAELEGDPRVTVHRLPANQGISAASNAALAHARGAWIALLDHDDELSLDAVAELVKRVNARPDADVVYSDEDKLDLAGKRCDPFFKPDWAPEHLLSCMYTCHLLAARRTLVNEVGGFRIGYEGAQDYDLMLRMVDRTSRIEHIAKILYHWRKSPESAAASGFAKPWAIDAGQRALEDYVRRNRLDAEVVAGSTPGRYHVRRSIAGRPAVSVIVAAFCPVRSMPSVAPLLRDLESTASGAAVDVVVCVEAGTSERLADRESNRVRLAEMPGVNERIGAINALVGETRGTHLLFLDPDLSPTSDDWMGALLELSTQEPIGVVGGKLLDRDGRLSHIGLVMGLQGIAASPFAQHPGTSDGYVSSAVGLRNYSAVSGACLMSRRAVFEELGGFDQGFNREHAAIDYCLRAGRAGYRIVFTPYACLRHTTAGTAATDAASDRLMRARWSAIVDDDPFYNRNLSREFLDYRTRP